MAKQGVSIEFNPPYTIDNVLQMIDEAKKAIENLNQQINEQSEHIWMPATSDILVSVLHNVPADTYSLKFETRRPDFVTV